jgi:hypothetical protein
MATNFDRELDQALDFSTPASAPYGQSYEALKQIAGSIERKLNDGLQGTPIKVEIEPGFQARMGQQLRVNVRIPSKQFRDTLFRAYIPDDGVPIYLDLYGEEPERCSNSQELQEKILDFLRRIKERMASYRDYARP